MDISPSALLINFVPRLPGIALTAVSAFLGRTENSAGQDALTQAVVAAAQPIMGTPAKVGRSQRVWRALGDWAGWGMLLTSMIGMSRVIGLEGVRVWEDLVVVEDVAMNREEPSLTGIADQTENQDKVLAVREAFIYAFKRLQDLKHGSVSCAMPQIANVEVRWTRHEPRVQGGDRESLCEAGGLSTRPVILYLHGGAHCLMDPTTHQWTTSTLCKLTSADICSVRFRLSPQHPFPAALIDAFVVYLSLLSTTPLASRAAAQPHQIIFAGDSSGGGLAASLLLLLLTLSRNNIAVDFNGSVIQISDPPCAGLALSSPWLDITRSLPSTSKNTRWDIIAAPPLDSASPAFPPDEVWPTKPLRAETYCLADICTHPLVSPLAASSEQWVGAPPVWICAGWEGFIDEVEVFARRVYQSSVEAKVWFDGWEGMPHCFGMVPWNWAGWEAMHAWADFCKSVVSGSVDRRDAAIWKTTVGKEKGRQRVVPMEKLGCEKEGVGYERELALTDEVVEQLMQKGRVWRIELEQQMLSKSKALS